MPTPVVSSEDGVFDLTREDLDALPYGVITLDRIGLILRYNYAEATLARRTTEQSIGLDFFTDVAPCTNVQAFKGRFDEFARHRDSGVERFDFSFAFRWGTQDVSITLLRKVAHDEINLIVHRRSHAILDLTSRSPLPTAVNRTRKIDHVFAWNFGSAEENAWRTTIHRDDVDSALQIVDAARANQEAYGLEYRVIGLDNAELLVEEHGSFAAGVAGRAAIVDVTERAQVERDLRRRAHFDDRTGQPNRTSLLKNIEIAAAASLKGGRVAGILAVEIDRLSFVSETYGRATAEELLRSAGLRLGECIRAGDSVARLDGNVFAVLLTDLDGVASVEVGARRILEALARPFHLAGRTHHIASHLGISTTPDNGSTPVSLLQAAETAMLRSQNDGHTGLTWFAAEMWADVELHARTQTELRVAIERDELELHYQPIVDIGTGRIEAVEALVRWNHPTRGFLMPADFIKIAERSDLINSLGNWVIREACRQAREWLDRGLRLHICINVSASQLRELDFIDFVAAQIAEAGIPAHTIELELTEGVMIEGFSAVIEMLTKLKIVGVRLAIDDFGTGYSSLSYLKYFPIDTLKIDRAFVADIVVDTFDRAIARTVLTLTNDLHLKCIAEGIETHEQLEVLRALGVRLIQGFFIARPQLPVSLDAALHDGFPGIVPQA